MAKITIIDACPDDLKSSGPEVADLVKAFAETYSPLEQGLHILVDARTGARYIECHVRASKLVSLSTIDVPLDPEEQAEYRANREIVEDHFAFERMKLDALARRTFSNIVTEYTDSFDPEHPLKVIGGQHRYIAINQAFEQGIDEYHGVKVYLGLSSDQRLDVQLISNTNIAVSFDLLDRMYETVSGPQLRNWCQEVGLLIEGQDFSDRRARGEPITVRAARTFILNYYLGRAIDPRRFEHTRTVPLIARTGGAVPE
jgi:hypothetical protein